MSKKVDRYRHLPKIRINSKDMSHNDSQNAYHSIDYGSRGRFELSEEYTINPGKTLKNTERKYFGQKYSSKVDNAITPESRAQMDSELKFRAGMTNTMNNTFTNHDQ